MDGKIGCYRQSSLITISSMIAAELWDSTETGDTVQGAEDDRSVTREPRQIFTGLIDELNGSQIDRIRASEVEVVQRAFRFFDEN